MHTAHTHTTNLKPSCAPIKAPSSAPPLLTSSRKQVATDSVQAPPHRCKSRGRQPMALRRLCLRCPSQRPRVSVLRLMMPRRLVIVVRSGVDQRCQTTSPLSRAGVNQRRQDARTLTKLAVQEGGGEGESSPGENEEGTKGSSQQTDKGHSRRGLTTTKGLAGDGGGRC